MKTERFDRHRVAAYATLTDDERARGRRPQRIITAMIKDYKEREKAIKAYDQARANFNQFNANLTPEQRKELENTKGIPSWYIDEYIKIPLNPRIVSLGPTEEQKAELKRQEDEYKKRHGIKGELSFDQYGNMQAEQRAIEKKQRRWFGSGTFINWIADLRGQTTS